MLFLLEIRPLYLSERVCVCLPWSGPFLASGPAGAPEKQQYQSPWHLSHTAKQKQRKEKCCWIRNQQQDNPATICQGGFIYIFSFQSQ